MVPTGTTTLLRVERMHSNIPDSKEKKGKIRGRVFKKIITDGEPFREKSVVGCGEKERMRCFGSYLSNHRFFVESRKKSCAM